MIGALLAGHTVVTSTSDEDSNGVFTDGGAQVDVGRQLVSPSDAPPETFAYVDPIGRTIGVPSAIEDGNVPLAAPAIPTAVNQAPTTTITITNGPSTTASPQIAGSASTNQPAQKVLPASRLGGRSTTTSTAPATTTNPTSTTAAATSAAPTTADAPTTTVAPVTTAARRTTTTTTTTVPPTTTAAPATTPAPAPRVGSGNGSGYIAPTAGTYIPVYDTAWQMLVRATPQQADQYFAALKNNGFSGAWTGVIHHAPATYNSNFAGGGKVGHLTNGKVVLTPEYIAHARRILDAANRHGMKVGLVAAWQNLYLPGGGADAGIPMSNQVRGTITTANSYAYGQQLVRAFGDHPAVSMWVFGGDAGTNNTEANKAVWREMARGVRDAGSRTEITYHTPTAHFGHLNYVGEPWLDFIAPETGHAQDAIRTEEQLRTARNAYGTGVWQGEPRYFNINFEWVNAAYRNPGVNEMRADAQAAENAGVTGYVYGDAGRWTWCQAFGDSTPCSANNIAASFGAGEAAVIDVFRTR